jgi:hypothetical protein
LGTGAGHLSPDVSFEAITAGLDTADSETCFEIFVVDKDIFRNLREKHAGYLRNKANLVKKNIRNPRIFMSYASDDPGNREWVIELAKRLRNNGVHAVIDHFDLGIGVFMPQWMTNEIMMADKVVLICDSNYVKKADFRKGGGGVGWETMIIQGDMLAQGQGTQKYLAIVREKEIQAGLPLYMRSRFCFHWPDDFVSEDEFKKLLLAIFECNDAPELGDIPAFIKDRLSQKPPKKLEN